MNPDFGRLGQVVAFCPAQMQLSPILARKASIILGLAHQEMLGQLLSIQISSNWVLSSKAVGSDFVITRATQCGLQADYAGSLMALQSAFGSTLHTAGIHTHDVDKGLVNFYQ